MPQKRPRSLPRSVTRSAWIPAAVNALTTYPIATVAKTKEKSLAADFLKLVEGDAGRTALAASGFAPPTS